MCDSLTKCSSSGDDYQQLTANTGIVNISTANSNLDGTGTLGLVLTGALNGTMIKTITIKATGSTSEGMVRLFITNNSDTVTTLFREVNIPEFTQTGVVPAFQITLNGNFMLPANYKLKASTQVGQSFNVIAEGVDWGYQANLPPSNSSFVQTVASTSIGKISVQNTNLNGSGTIVSILTASNSAKGTDVGAITVKANGNTAQGMVRLFLSGNGGSTWFLWKELMVPGNIQTSVEQAFECTILSDFSLQANFQIGASTQNADAFSLVAQATDWDYPTF